MANTVRNVYSISILIGLLSLAGCLGAPAETGLKTTPPAGVYNGQTTSTKYNQTGVIYGTLSNQTSYGKPVVVATLAMNQNQQIMGIFSATLSTTTDQSISCLSAADSVSLNPTSLASISGVINFSNCQWNGSQFSASYNVYRQSTGTLLDSGTLTLTLDSNCQAYSSAVTTIGNGSYSGSFQSCLAPESNALSGVIANSSILFNLTQESNLALLVGTAGSDYTQQLTESVTAGSYAGYITPLSLTNLNQTDSNYTGNYVSYYDYGILNLSESN